MDKTDYAAIAVLLMFFLPLHFAFVWDALVSLGILHARTITAAAGDLVRGQMEIAFLIGFLVCHLLKG